MVKALPTKKWGTLWEVFDIKNNLSAFIYFPQCICCDGKK